MSSSYSSLDWVLSHWSHFTVHRFICVCVYLCFFCFILHSCCIIVSTVGWTWWDWSLILWTYLPSVLWHCWLGHLTREKPVPDMTYNVFGGTLSLTQSTNSWKFHHKCNLSASGSRRYRKWKTSTLWQRQFDNHIPFDQKQTSADNK